MIGTHFIKLFNPSSSARLLKKSVTKVIFKVNYCSSSFVSSGNFSIFNAKKTIKLSGAELDDGFTCLRTTCPVCDTTKNNANFFINKTTGMLNTYSL